MSTAPNPWRLRRVATMAATVLLAFPLAAAAAELSVMGDISLVGDSSPSTMSETHLGDLDFFVSQGIDDHTRVLAEVFLEGAPEITVDLERMYIQRDLTDTETLTFGRNHLPVILYNQIHHDGAFMLNFADRPAYLDFEDSGTSLFRMHGVGLFLHTTRFSPGDAWNLPVDVGVADAAGFDTSVPVGERELWFNDGGNLGDGAMLMASIGLEHTTGHTFTVSAFTVRDSIMEQGNGTSPSASGLAQGEKIGDQQAAGIDLHMPVGPASLTAQAASIDFNSRTGTDGDRSSAGFAELFLPLHGRHGIGVRQESVSIAANDPLLAGFLARSDYDATSLVWRYELSESNILKLQGTAVDTTAGNYQVWKLQWSFLIP